MADRFDNTSQAVPGLSLPFSSEAEQSVLGACCWILPAWTG